MALILIMLCLIAAAMCIDVAYMQLVQTQLRSATDAASQAGVIALAQGATLEDAKQTTKDVALANEVAGAGLILDDSDIVFGVAIPDTSTGRYVFTPGNSAPNALGNSHHDCDDRWSA
jgi:Flp pilus assembly protein TadG